MCKITFLRHAPLAKQHQKCFNGHIDLPIDENLVDFKIIEKIKKQKYDLVFSSDLKRCTQTLDLLNFSYEKDARLREIKFKEEFEGKSFEQVSKMRVYDEKYLNSFESWHGFIASESIESYKKRVKEFLKQIPKNKNILVCSHGGTIKLVEAILNNKPYEQSSFSISYLESFIYKNSL